MRAISLWQPWASAIALGNKRIETRGWCPASSKFCGPLAIHAAKRWAPEQREFAETERALGRIPSRLPFGAIVAICMLTGWEDAWEMVQTGKIGAVEKIYGDYSPNRYAWILEDIVALSEPIPFKGAQGFFNFPDDLLKAQI